MLLGYFHTVGPRIKIRIFWIVTERVQAFVYWIHLVRRQYQLLTLFAVVRLWKHWLFRAQIVSILQVLRLNVNYIRLGLRVHHGYFWLFPWLLWLWQNRWLDRLWSNFLDLLVYLTEFDVRHSWFLGRSTLLGNRYILLERFLGHESRLLLLLRTGWSLCQTGLLVKSDFDRWWLLFCFLDLFERVIECRIYLW